MIAIFPEIAQAAAAADPERLSILCRKYFGEEQKFAPRLDGVRLLRQAGLEVETLPIDSHAALLAKDERGTFRIVCVLSEKLDVQAREFALAHQLGHFLLHVQPLIARGEWNVSGYRETVCPLRRYALGEEDPAQPETDRVLERAADDFAAALLLPKAMVVRAAEKLPGAADVAHFFGVTEGCLKRRMQQIGLQADEPVNFIDAARKIGIPMSEQGEELRQDIDPHGSLEAPAADKAIPRSFAASSYGRVGKATDAKAPEILTGAAPPAASDASPVLKGPGNTGKTAKPLLKGMERIREIARKIDKIG